MFDAQSLSRAVQTQLDALSAQGAMSLKARKATRMDAKRIGLVAAQAFGDNAAFCHILRDERSQRILRLQRLFTLMYSTLSDAAVIVEDPSSDAIVGGFLLPAPRFTPSCGRVVCSLPDVFRLLVWTFGARACARARDYFGACANLQKALAEEFVKGQSLKADLDAVFVSPSLQGQGIGSAMVKGALEEASKFVSITFFTETKQNQRFYEKLGCKTIQNGLPCGVEAYSMVRYQSSISREGGTRGGTTNSE